MEIVGYVEAQRRMRRRRLVRYAGLALALLAVGGLVVATMQSRGYMETPGWLAVFWSLWLIVALVWPVQVVYQRTPELGANGKALAMAWLIIPWVWLGVEQGEGLTALIFGALMAALAYMNWRDER